jgi:hypothetical protein
LAFNSEFPISWKILYKADNLEDKEIKKLIEKITKFTKERTVETLTTSTDIYTIDKNFIVIHGIKSKENAIGIAQVLKEFKEYKIADTSYVISSENYKVVQIKKNFDEYVLGDWLTKEIVPIPKNIVITEDNSTPKAKVVTKADVKSAMNNVRSTPKPDASQPQNQVGQPQTQQNSKSQNSKADLDTQDAPPGSMMPPTPKK